MTKRMIAFILVAVLACGVLAACEEDKLISAEKAQAIALQDMDITADQATVHVHVADGTEDPCFIVYVTYQGKTLAYVINAIDGQIVSKNESSHSH